jgi:hypothetical protein
VNLASSADSLLIKYQLSHLVTASEMGDEKRGGSQSGVSIGGVQL